MLFTSLSSQFPGLNEGMKGKEVAFFEQDVHMILMSINSGGGSRWFEL